ncbi:MAG: cobyrinate a,c-diamide synthase [Pseudomonadota bacterium]
MAPKLPRGLVIAAPHSNSGKTIFTMGLAAALTTRGMAVKVAKGGPGFIDPQFLGLATQTDCFSLDKWAMGAAQLCARARELGTDTDLLVIEGMMGMYDGAASTDGSTANIAETLDLPVILVVNASGQAQSIAALVHGFATFQDRPGVAGIVAVQTGSARHGELLGEALAQTPIPYLGAIPRSPDLVVPSRHLGLVQALEHKAPAELVAAAGQAVLDHIDLETVRSIAAPLPKTTAPKRLPPLGQRIAVARDEAFAFAYPHQLLDWRAQGADLVFISPLADQAVPSDCDAVFLPGGYPELHGRTLAGAARFLESLQAAAARRALIYGECGGYMVLGRGLIDKEGTQHKMAGLLDHVTSFAEPKMHLGYRQLIPVKPAFWTTPLSGHEFHYSRLVESGTDAPLFHQRDARGQDLGLTGGQRGSVMGSYAHIIDQAPD